VKTRLIQLSFADIGSEKTAYIFFKECIMLKKSVIVIGLSLLFCTVLFADTENEGIRNLLVVKSGAAVGLYEPWITGNVEYDLMLWRSLGIGAELGINQGLTYQDLHATGFIFVKLGWFYLGGGISYELKDSVLPENSEYDTFAYPTDPINPAFTTGLNIPIFKIGPGKLGLCSSLDWYVTDEPIYFEDFEEDEGFLVYIIRQIFSGVAQTVVGVLLSGKPALEVSYTMGL
jgi:hypothetical protein